MDDQRLTGRRFGPEFVEDHRRKVGKYPPEQRQLTYAIAVNDDCASWRQVAVYDRNGRGQGGLCILTVGRP